MAGPRLPRLLARLLLPSDDREIILGDLEELHSFRSDREGAHAANRRYAYDVVASILARRFRRSTPLPPPRSPRPRRTSVFADLPSELAAAVRSLLRRPGFTAVAASTLALGVGTTSVGFAMVNQLLLRPLPGVRDPAGAAYLHFTRVQDPDDHTGISLPDFDLLRAGAWLVEGMASYGRSSVNVTVGEGRPTEVRVNLIYGDFFEVLGVVPAVGRLLAARETVVGEDPFVAVISGRLWSSLFGGGEVVGRTFNANGQLVTIVGVAGGDFSGPERGDAADLWMPWHSAYAFAGTPPERMLSRGSISHGDLLIRPRHGVTTEAVEAQISGILERIAASVPESREHLSSIRPLVLAGLHAPPLFREWTYRALTLMGGVVVLLLLIACANVANLLFFRGVSRQGEVATRRALGASGARVVRQHLAESVVIATLGGGLGLIVGWLIALPFRGLGLITAEPFEGLRLDERVLAFAAGSVLLTAFIFGTLPALLAGRFDLSAALSESGGRNTGRRGWMRAGVSAAQIALSLSLVVGAFLLLRTLGNLYAEDIGFDIEDVASLTVDLGDVPLDEQDAIHRSLVQVVSDVPGVEAAALDVYGPLSGAGMGGRIRLPEVPESERMDASMTLVTPNWFDVLRVEPLSGRTFRAGDWEAGAPPRVVLTAALARTLFGTTEVAGNRVVAGFGRGVEAEVVGVIDDLQMHGPQLAGQPTFIQPFAPFSIGYVTVLARASGLDGERLAAITAAVESVLPDVAVPQAVPVVRRLGERLSEQRLFARMIALVAVLSVVMAAVGLYAVVAFTVAGRRRELGIRLALGADGRELAALVARYALAIVALGMAGGLAGAYALSRVLESRLFGVAPGDPISYAGTAIFFAAVAAVACWVPTRAAMRVDPVVSLRRE